MAAGTFKTIEDAQNALCPKYRPFEPNAAAHATYNALFALYEKVYFGLGQANAAPVALGDVLPILRRISARTA